MFCILAVKAMAPPSSTLAWKIPWTEEPGGLQSTLRVGHDWATSLSLFTFLHWRRKRQPTPVFLPGETQGRGSLVGCRLWGRTVGHDWSDLAAAVITMYPFGQKSFPLINYIDNSCVMHNKCIFLITLDSMFAQVHLSKHISRINKIIISFFLLKSHSFHILNVCSSTK